MILEYFTDPVLRAPTIGSMLMCLSTALVGVVVFICRRSLLGETLSHAAFPGIALGAALLATFFPSAIELLPFAVLGGGFCTALLGLKCIALMEQKWRVKSDAALTFILATFFGVGILISSRLQFTHTLWYKQVQMLLYGQVATMTEEHIFLYGGLAAGIAFILFLLYRPIQVIYFDREFAEGLRIKVKSVERILFVLLVLSIVIGMRSVGLVLMSGMLIAPAVAARQCTRRLSSLFFLAGFFGLCSGFFGNVLSHSGSFWLGTARSLPTGPIIVLFASFLCLLTLFFSPERGVALRALRVLCFRMRCRRENLLKLLWKKHEMPLKGLLPISLQWRGLIERKENGNFILSEEGKRRAQEIVRLHRLWEVYLVSLGQRKEKVHHHAEEMEHILTPELEEELGELLSHPTRDPHEQPIPTKGGL